MTTATIVKLALFAVIAVLLVKWIQIAYKKRDKVSCYFAVSWVFFSMYALSSVRFVKFPKTHTMEEIFLLLFAMSVSFATATMLLKKYPTHVSFLRLYVFVPSVLIIYRLLYLKGYGIPGIGGVAGNAGSLLLFSGSIAVTCFREKNEKIFGISLLLLGLMCVLYKVLIVWNRMLADIILMTVSLGMGLLAMWLTLAYEFKIVPANETITTEFRGGEILLVFEEDYPSIIESIRALPKLVFTRRPGLYDKTWNICYVSSVGQEHLRYVPPTDLHRILDSALAFVKKTREKGTTGVVIIDCLEYLKIYNEFNSLLKFLSTLRDHILLYGGTLIVVIERNAWSEKELALLRRILE